ncbi:MAG: hypothetical protein JXQ27_07470 [Acidobacteria bacterium]|nr:hypothetical protein [Acidobacteriota bacterium]
MPYHSPSSGTPSRRGCLPGCGCFVIGFGCGLVVIPLLVYLLLSWPWFQRQTDRIYDTHRLSRQLEEVTRRMNAAADKGSAGRAAGAAGVVSIPGEEGSMSDFNRTFAHESLEIRFRCTERAATERPFIHGIVINNGSETLRHLRLESVFVSGEGHESREEMDIIADGSPHTLAPGEQKRFVLHPRAVPPDWSADRMELRVTALR